MVPRILAAAVGLVLTACASAPPPADQGMPAQSAPRFEEASKTETQVQAEPPRPEPAVPRVRPEEPERQSRLFPLPEAGPLPETGVPSASAKKVELVAAGLPLPAPPPEEKPNPAPEARRERPAADAAKKPAPAPERKPPAQVRNAAPEKTEKPPENAKSAAAEKPSVPLKEADVSGEVGKAVKVALPGIGWIFLGDQENSGKIRYQGKAVQEGNTVFSFIAYTAGNYTLKFQQQDLTVNSVRQNEVSLKIDPPKAQSAEKDSRTPDGSPRPGASKTGGDELGAAATGGKAAGFDDLPSDDERMRKLLEQGRTREALDEIERFLVEKGGTLANIDEWYVRLARLYENDRELRNMKKALWYYEKLRDGFPMSRYWDEADGKSRYIRRNFFDIK